MARLSFNVLVLGHLMLCPAISRAQLSDFPETGFTKPDSVAAVYKGHSLDNLYLLSYKLTGPFSTDIEKFRTNYKWVCDNIENDYYLYELNKRKREKLKGDEAALADWNNDLSDRLFKKLLREKKTVCTGYAYLVKELSFYAGIPCEIVDGYGKTLLTKTGGPGGPNHSWNAVKLNDKWYLCDPTWSSGVINPVKKDFVKQFSEGYFLTDPDLFATNHYPLDTAWLLQTSPLSFERFLDAPLAYKGAFNHKVLPEAPDKFLMTLRKGEKTTFRFIGIGEKLPEGVRLELRNSGNAVLSKNTGFYRDENGHYCLDHQFGRKGAYMADILVDGDYVFTWKVRVVRR